MKDIVNIPRRHINSEIGYLLFPIIAVLSLVAILLQTNSFGSLTIDSIIIFSLIGIPAILYFAAGAYWFRKIRYVIKDDMLLSYPYTKIKIKLSEIKKVERIKQIHFPLCFSSLRGATGLVNMHVPGVGSVPSIATNGDDGIMITTNAGERYVITPSNPEEFMKHLRY